MSLAFGKRSLRSRTKREYLETLESRILLSANISSFKSPALPVKSLAHPTSTALKKRGIVPHSASPPSTGFTPQQIRHAYGFDQISFNGIVGDGAGQTIAIIGAYDYPTAAADLEAFDAFFNLPPPPSFRRIAQDGSTNYPPTSPPQDWAREAAMDIQWSHAIAPGADIVLIEANDNSPENLIQKAVEYARNLPGVSVISMSFGMVESPIESTFYDNYFTTPTGHTGITFVASTGDTGQPAGYPAYSPNVVAVGGTSLSLSGNNYQNESAWSLSGGGISLYESKPSYQSAVTQSATQRTAPDISFVANPDTGVVIYDSYDYGTANPWTTLGGTSLAAPIFAGLVAIANQGRDPALGTLDGKSQTLPRLYQLPASDFHDITTGSNGSPAKPGYDLVTGRGSPIANLLAVDLAAVPSISGTVFEDPNNNGIKDAAESAMPDITVYLDANNNGLFDIGGTTIADSGNINLAIPDNKTTGITSTIPISGLATPISDLNLTLNINHDYDGDLIVYLIGPDNTQVTLFSRIGGSANNFTNTILDDQAAAFITSGSPPYAGTFRPNSGTLSAFNGKSANGNWRIKVVDAQSHNASTPNTGSLVSWSLSITTSTETSTTTSDDGAYLFASLAAGAYIARAVAPAGYALLGAASHSVNIYNPSTGNNFALFPTIFNAPAPHSTYYLWIDSPNPDPSQDILNIGATASPAAPLFQIPLTLLPSLRFNLNTLGSRIIIDFRNDNPIPLGNIIVDGGNIPGNELVLIGQSSTQKFNLTDTQITSPATRSILYQNLSTLTLYTSTIYFSGTLSTLENLNIDTGTYFYWG